MTRYHVVYVEKSTLTYTVEARSPAEAYKIASAKYDNNHPPDAQSEYPEYMDHDVIEAKEDDDAAL